MDPTMMLEQKKTLFRYLILTGKNSIVSTETVISTGSFFV